MDEKQKPWPCLRCLGVIMEPIDEDHCKCPICKTEVWYSYEEKLDHDEIEDLMQDSIVRNNRNPEFSIIEGPPAKGGGSSNSGRSRRKQLLQKPSTTELYRRLNMTKAKVFRKKKVKQKGVDKKAKPGI